MVEHLFSMCEALQLVSSISFSPKEVSATPHRPRSVLEARNSLVPMAAIPKVHVSIVREVLHNQLPSMPHFISTKLSSPFPCTTYLALSLSKCPAIYKPETKVLGPDSMYAICLPSSSTSNPPTSPCLHTTSLSQHRCLSFPL